MQGATSDTKFLQNDRHDWFQIWYVPSTSMYIGNIHIYRFSGLNQYQELAEIHTVRQKISIHSEIYDWNKHLHLTDNYCMVSEHPIYLKTLENPF